MTTPNHNPISDSIARYNERRHSSVVGVLVFFDYESMPDAPEREAARWHYELAQRMVDYYADSPELTNALRKLLEARDSFMRAARL